MLSFSNVSIINYNIFAAFCVCVFKRYIYEYIRSIYELNIIIKCYARFLSLAENETCAKENANRFAE